MFTNINGKNMINSHKKLTVAKQFNRIDSENTETRHLTLLETNSLEELILKGLLTTSSKYKAKPESDSL